MNRSPNKSALLIAIAGGSGSGKSWLAERLARELDVTIICIDSFYRDRIHLSPARRAAINYDHPRAIDWSRLHDALVRAKSGKSFELPDYSFEEHQRTGLKRVKPGTILILEGLWALRNRLIRPLIDLGIFVEAETKLRRDRRLERDVKNRGRSEASVLRQFREQVEPMHARFVAPQCRRANFVVHSPIDAQSLRLLRQRIDELRTTRSLPTFPA